MLALIKADTIIDPAVPEGIMLTVAEGLGVSPTQDGWEFEDYRLATIVTPTPPAGAYTATVELVGGVPTTVYAAVSSDSSIDQQITSAPEDLFGGPTLGEIFNVD
jgi:hypothetical protein